SGVSELAKSISMYEEWFRNRQQKENLNRVVMEVKEAVYSKLENLINKAMDEKDTRAMLYKIAERNMDPDTLADLIIKRIFKNF
ncbi:MAG: hypothetical protein QXR69_03290, partial [Conexivisphaerales archaeon]